MRTPCGGFLALPGGLSDRSGLVVAGSITAGVGLVAVGIYNSTR